MCLINVIFLFKKKMCYFKGYCYALKKMPICFLNFFNYTYQRY